MTVENTRTMNVNDFEITMEEILGCLSGEEYPEFEKVMSVCQSILDEPSKFVGSQALIVAAQLSALRTKIGNRAQYYKTAKGDTKESIIIRRRKDLLMSMYSSLEENINTLKLLGRIEGSMVRWN